MKCVIQRVRSARLLVDNVQRAGFDGPGLVVMLGIEATDQPADAEWIVHKLPVLRIFPDDAGKLNMSVLDIAGGLLVVPNFTLAADASRGRRPSFERVMPPALAEAVFDGCVAAISAIVQRTSAGVFGADMQITMTADGPITILLDSCDRAR